jgi:hypothetical protein
MDEEGSRGQSDYGCFAPDMNDCQIKLNSIYVLDPTGLGRAFQTHFDKHTHMDYGCFAPDLIARVSYECACRNVSEMPYLGLSDQDV